MDQLYMLKAFVSAAQHQSFSKAAASLGVTTGSISKAIAKLEASIQTRVLHRTTRSVTLTEEAQSYYLSCCRLLEELEEANRRIMREREVDSGKLRLVIHPMLVSDTFSQFLSSYREVAPNVNLVVSVHEGAVNLYDGQFDMAMLPPHQVEQSAVIRRTLFRSSRSLVASADYLAQRGIPRRAADLSEHFLLLPTQSRQRNTNYVQMSENGAPVQVIPMSSMDGNDVLLRAAALAGAGIAELPEAIAREDVAMGKLVPVLPNCSISDSEVEVCLFYSHRELLPARFRTFVDFCTEFFRLNGARRRMPFLHAEQRAA
ncbi:LysR family transcriptional regulator [Paraburkholderia sp. Tr-20389]|uniref:LysR family transcriptional regulator n=1 Tax=Paraburkholderia sp. Tr-20389 TaxID=2703903 RepID=UPI0019822A2E|nr:LysR family transcriptional regulator [Paraburkholderia sp. Tr-20389]MBN3751961.1 LysR family transcriptional regulator [Paraburkholderia sp. Tr-20389]